MKIPAKNVNHWRQDQLWPREFLTLTLTVQLDVPTQTYRVGYALHDLLTEEYLELGAGQAHPLDVTTPLIEEVTAAFDMALREYVDPFPR